MCVTVSGYCIDVFATIEWVCCLWAPASVYSYYRIVLPMSSVFMGES